MKTGLLISCMLLIFPTFAQNALRTKAYNLDKGLAIQGYDPVAYFIQQKAVKGKKTSPHWQMV